MSRRTGRESCYFCEFDHADMLETHHIIPTRLNGPDHDENKVDVCPQCHSKLEELYDDRVWRFVGSDERLIDTHTRNCHHCNETLILDDGECVRCGKPVDMAKVDYLSIEARVGGESQ